MSLGQNLQFLRKRNDITQEQLAEKLDVSRQSISKWESDTTYPEMDKLIQLTQMFHCSMDDLLQKDIRTLYVEDKADYDKHMNTFSKMIALGVTLILSGLTIMLFLSGMGSIKKESSPFYSDAFCTVIFFIFLIIAVAIFIVTGLQHGEFEKKNPYIENFYNEKEIELFHKKFTIMITTGVVLILIGIVIMIGVESVLPNIYEDILPSIFLLFVTISVCLFVYAGMQQSKYNIKEYNLSHDKESETYKKNQLAGTICGCLMLTATIIYLILGFVFNEWGMPSVVVFPVFGIGCGIVSMIVDNKQIKK